MELWDLYTEGRTPTGQTMLRGQPTPKGFYRLVVCVCLFNPKGEMLIQQRQHFKEGWPNHWDLTACGSAMAGDTSQSAAQRELFEEIGYAMDFGPIRPHLTINFPGGFGDYYLIQAEPNLSELRLQAEEVQAVRWASRESIRQMIADGRFIPYRTSLIDLLFDMRSSYGPGSPAQYKP